MSTTTSITTSYAGQWAREYIGAALLSGKTLAEGAITIKPNIKYKEVIKKFANTNLIKNASCDFDPTGTLTLTERILEPEEFQINEVLCKADFRSDWEAIEMGISVYDNLPPTFADFIVQRYIAQVAEKTEQNIWAGVNATEGEFDGLTVLMAADSDVNDAVNGGETSFDSTNILELMENSLDALPSAVYGKEDLTYYLPTIAFQAFIRSQAGFGANGLGAAGINAQGVQWYNNNNAVSFLGIKVQHTPGMPSDHLVLGQASNLYFGTGLLADHSEVKLLDMQDLDGSQNVRLIMRFTAGVQYGFGSDLVLLTLA